MYWVNPANGQNEIIDGHNRHRIAQELGILYDVQEVAFATGSLTAVKYWMHRTQSGRRGGATSLQRMTELYTQLMAETGKEVTKTEIIKQVAKDADKSEVRVWKANAKAKVELTPEQQEDATIKVILKYLSQLSDSGKVKLREMLE